MEVPRFPILSLIYLVRSIAGGEISINAAGLSSSRCNYRVDVAQRNSSASRPSRHAIKFDTCACPSSKESRHNSRARVIARRRGGKHDARPIKVSGEGGGGRRKCFNLAELVQAAETRLWAARPTAPASKEEAIMRASIVVRTLEPGAK